MPHSQELCHIIKLLAKHSGNIKIIIRHFPKTKIKKKIGKEEEEMGI